MVHMCVHTCTSSYYCTVRYIHDMYVPHECVMYMQVQEGVQLIVCHIIHVHVGGVVYEASYYI